MTEKFKSREERRRKQLASKHSNRGNKRKTLFKKIFTVLIAIGIAGLLIGTATFAYLIKDTPKLDEALLRDPISSKVHDKDGNFVRELGVVRRDFVNFEDIPEVMINAVLATEDARFFKHSGIDLIRLGGAVIANITDGFGSEGASTITQQLVKNSFLTQDKKLKRKAQEAWLAVQLERKYTKEEIFEMYVNKNNMGGNVHGIATAAKVYYGKDLQDVNVEEAAMLAGLFQSPNRYHPFKHPDKAEKRRNIVLSLMHHHKFISEEDMKKAQETKVVNYLVPEEQRETNLQPYDSFIDYVINEVEELGDFNIFADGLTVYTTLDPSAQQYVEKILDTDEIINYPDDEFQAGISLLDTKTGAIRALGGGRNQKVQRAFSFATDIERQPGSTIKPILDYAPAIEHLKWSTYHYVDDKPYTYSDGTPVNNWDRRHMGPMPIREALARSRNIPAIQAIQAVGLDKAQQFISNLGINLDEIYEPYAIGGFKTGVSPLQMAGAYSALGNNGFYTEPYAITKIVLRDGTVINTIPEQEVAMSDYTAFMVTDMLKSVLKSSYGTGVAANIPNLHVAGKTGTTNYTDEEISKYNVPDGAVPDAWFVGYTTNYTASIWTGYSERKKYIPSGPAQAIARNIFKNLMTNVSANVETADFIMPNSVVKVGIEKGTNPPQLPSEFTPDSEIVYEYFVKGTEPKAVSEKFDKLESPTNLEANFDEENNQLSLTWDYSEDHDEQLFFDITAKIDGNEEQSIATTFDYNLNIGNPKRGATYHFNVIAKIGELASDPISVTIKIPEMPDQNNEPPFPPIINEEDDEQPNGNNNEDDDGNDDLLEDENELQNETS